MSKDGAEARRPPRTDPVFVSGPLLRHILVMTGTGALGLVSIFLGDLANMLFLSWLNDEAVIAAVGYASSILFFTISIGIGLSIAATAHVSPAIGAGHMVRARRLAVNSHLAAAAVSGILGLVVWFSSPRILALLGASGRALELAESYLDILVPTLPFLAVAMTSAAILRSVGDANRAMWITLTIAIVNILLDPMLILGMGLGIEGAAIASSIARLCSMLVGLYGVVKVHGLMGRPRLRPFLADAPAIASVAIPAVLTNIASPISNAYVTAAMAPFGDSAVAGWAIVGRIIPVAFGAIYALSGSIGPILGQNFGAREPRRMRRAFTLSLCVTGAFTGAAWLVLAVLAIPLAGLFNATGLAHDLVVFFCRWLAPLFVFMGLLFVANAAFNTLGRAHFSTLLNWGRATVGTVPFVTAGASLAGPHGVLAAFMASGIIFGLLAVWLCYRMMSFLEAESPSPGPPAPN